MGCFLAMRSKDVAPAGIGSTPADDLVLLTRKKKSSASNYGFARKKETYFSRNGISPFVLTTQVVTTRGGLRKSSKNAKCRY